VLFAVDDVGAHGEEKPGVHQDALDTILDLLDVQSWQTFQTGQYGFKQAVDFICGVFPGRLAGGDQRLADFVRVEGDQTAVAFVQTVESCCDQRALHSGLQTLHIDV
jgi:hypothetical protein